MSRYNPGLEAGIIPGNLRAFKKDGQRLTLYDFWELAVEVAQSVDWNEVAETVTEGLGDYDFGSVYEIVAEGAPDFAQFEQYLGADALQTTADTFGAVGDALGEGVLGDATNFLNEAAGIDIGALGEGVLGDATNFLTDAVDLQAYANDLIASVEAGQYSIGDKLGSLASSLSTKVSDYIANELPKQATAFAKNQLVAAAKSVVASTFGDTPAGKAAAAALNRGIDKTANAVVASSTSYGVFGTSTSAFSVTDGPAAAVPNIPAYDDQTNTLNPGWALDENNNPVFVGGGFVDSTGQYLSPPPNAVNPALASIFGATLSDAYDAATGKLKEGWEIISGKAINVAKALAGGLTINKAVDGSPYLADKDGATVTTRSLLDAAAIAVLPKFVGNGPAVDAAGKTAALTNLTRQQDTLAAQGLGNASSGDWRVRLSLAPKAGYLYNDAAVGTILYPLFKTGGVIFPYTPTITTSYKAEYEPYSLTHSNFKGYFYKSSYVDPVNIKATFTAQDTAEANYLLAVIHFFRSVTKMFYGQDANRGAPPPLVFLTGLGQYQFNKHPCVVASFEYNLPAEVNYIRASSVFNVNGTNTLTARESTSTASNPLSYTIERLRNLGQGISPGAQKAPAAPAFVRILGQASAQDPPSTYVPTKMDINISLYPMQSRQQVSQVFSLAQFANGKLLTKGFW